MPFGASVKGDEPLIAASQQDCNWCTDMKNRYQEFSRGMFITDGSNPSNPKQTMSLQSAWFEDFVVDNPGTVTGDHKSPYGLEFRRRVTTMNHGQVSSYYTDSSYLIVDGAMGSVPIMPNLTTGTFDPDIYNRALSEVYEMLRGEVDLSVDLFQGGQTASLVKKIRSAVRYTVDFLEKPINRKLLLLESKLRSREIRRKVEKGDKSAVKWLGEKRLEYMYGVKPLVQDVYGSVAELFRVFPMGLRIRKRARGYSSDLTRNVQVPFETGLRANFDYYKVERVLIDVRFDVGASTANLISNFTSLNPVSIAWELMPWSFVADWFIDVGGYVRNVETAVLNRSNFKSGYVSKGIMVAGVTSYVGTVNLGNGFKYSSYSGSNQMSHQQRVVLLSAPFPQIPRFKADLGSTRLLNAGALLSQLLKR